MGKGYLDDFSKSVNAAEAEENGEFPASVCARKLGILVEAVRRCEEAQIVAHHTSSFFNETMYYDLETLREWAKSEEGKTVIAEVRAELAAARRQAAEVFEDCTVEWLEWGGTRKHPMAIERNADGCHVEVKRQTATITLPNGESFRKRLMTNGFRFENKTHRLNAWGEVIER